MPRKRINFDKQNGLTGTLFEPPSGWSPPTSFPNIPAGETIGLDIESRDPDIKSRGPGFLRGDAEMVGFSVSATEASWYFPFRHLGGGNLDKDSCIRFARDLLGDSSRFIVGANLQYELEGFNSAGIDVKGKLVDVQLAEALIDEESTQGYSLDNLCKKYLGGGKDEKLLREAAAAYGVDPKESMWKMPSKFVGPYAEFDSLAPLQIFKQQLAILKREDLEGIFEIESRLLPVLWKMRKRGIRMDLEGASKLSLRLAQEEDAMRAEILQKFGVDIDEWSGIALGIACDKLKIPYPRTPTGMPSFTADMLEDSFTAQMYPFLQYVSDLRELSKMRKTFVDKWIFGNVVGDRIHPRWKQMASDDGGTRTGRMAASNPNPQQVPAGKYRKTGKSNDIGKMIRACFIPEDGKRWAKFDYASQEPRILVHFAAMIGATGASAYVDRYRENRLYKIYEDFAKVCELDIRPTKDCYLGRCYGMGIKKLAMKFNKTEAEAKAILDKFDAGAPFIKETADKAMRLAEERGWIKTLMGRKRHFENWEPVDYWKMRQEGVVGAPCKLELAQQQWPGKKLRRSNCHKALNALIQGSAADMTKMAMLKTHDELGDYPYMQVHDELNFGVVDEAHAKQIQQRVEGCVTMQVPVVADLSLGDHWK